MTVKINIECQDAGELTEHLQEIIKEIKKLSKKHGKYEFEKIVSFEDSNCYGTHNVFIRPEVS